MKSRFELFFKLNKPPQKDVEILCKENFKIWKTKRKKIKINKHLYFYESLVTQSIWPRNKRKNIWK